MGLDEARRLSLMPDPILGKHKLESEHKKNPVREFAYRIFIF